jgi:hypothetical protein
LNIAGKSTLYSPHPGNDQYAHRDDYARAIQSTASLCIPIHYTAFPREANWKNVCLYQQPLIVFDPSISKAKSQTKFTITNNSIKVCPKNPMCFDDLMIEMHATIKPEVLTGIKAEKKELKKGKLSKFDPDFDVVEIL